MESSSSCDDGHRSEVDSVLDRGDLKGVHALVPDPCMNLAVRTMNTYDQIADENLQDLCSQAGPTSKHSLQDTDQKMPQRRAYERAIGRHLWYSRIEVVPMFAAVFGDPGCKDFLHGRKRA